jgi:hypothetical protein
MYFIMRVDLQEFCQNAQWKMQEHQNSFEAILMEHADLSKCLLNVQIKIPLQNFCGRSVRNNKMPSGT